MRKKMNHTPLSSGVTGRAIGEVQCVRWNIRINGRRENFRRFTVITVIIRIEDGDAK
jgi:hypothetical protein